jgi:hypothetical protein
VEGRVPGHFKCKLLFQHIIGGIGRFKEAKIKLFVSLSKDRAKNRYGEASLR